MLPMCSDWRLRRLQLSNQAYGVAEQGVAFETFAEVIGDVLGIAVYQEVA